MKHMIFLYKDWIHKAAIEMIHSGRLVNSLNIYNTFRTVTTLIFTSNFPVSPRTFRVQ